MAKSNAIFKNLPLDGATEPVVGAGPLILVADGLAGSRNAIAEQLNARGFRTLEAESGGAALMMLRSDRPALVLVDQNIQGLPGIELLREMRGRKDNALTPVIIMTTSADPGLAVAAMRAGADDHILMPCPGDIIAARISRQLERVRETVELRQAVAALDARLVRRTLEMDELQVRIETMSAEKAALAAGISARADKTARQPVKSIAAI